MVTVTGPPTAAVAVAENVTTLEPVAGLVANEAVTPEGSPAAARVTLPVNPFAPATAMVLVPLLPCATDTVDGADDSVKLGAGLTVSANVVLALNAPDVPVIVTVTGPPNVAAPDAVSVNTLEDVAGLVANEAVTPLGRPVAASVTAPENPP
jgi:hypothetical protein